MRLALSRLIRRLAPSYTPAVLLLGGIAGTTLWTGIPIAQFTRDPAAITGTPPFYGLLSNLGIVLWAGTTTLCFFCAHLLRRVGAPASRTAFFLTGGCLTLLLLVDDLFLMHEYAASRYLFLSELVVYAVYALLGLSWFVYFRTTILQQEPVVLLLACSFFALSIMVDLPFPGKKVTNMLMLLEDGTKWLGIVSWLEYWWIAARTTLEPIRVLGVAATPPQLGAEPSRHCD
jgi:hypothetical protein